MKAHNVIIAKSTSATTEANGVIGVNPNKPEFGSVQMATQSFSRSASGFMSQTKVVYFLSGSVKDLEALVEAFDLKVGDDYSAKVEPSRIIIKESTEPFYSGQQCKINPSTGEEVTSGGEVVYRETALVAAGSSEFDSKLSNDKITANSTSESPFVESDELSA